MSIYVNLCLSLLATIGNRISSSQGFPQREMPCTSFSLLKFERLDFPLPVSFLWVQDGGRGPAVHVAICGDQ